jgi:hypothetical protein
MENVLPALALLSCPVGMGLMMWFMAKGMRNDRPSRGTSLEDLRAEPRRLSAELDAAERDRRNR